MALNFSHRPVFAPHLPEDNLVAPMRITNGYLVEGIPERVDDCFDYGRERSERCGSQDSVHKDIIDLLPSDPFGMDITSTFTAITGWLEDFEVDYSGYGRDQVATNDGNCQFFAGLNFFWNNAVRFKAFPGHSGFDHKQTFVGGFTGDCGEDNGGGSSGNSGLRCPCDMDMDMDMDMEDVLSLGTEIMDNKNFDLLNVRSEGFHEVSGFCSDEDGEAPHTAFGFALGFLGVRDLLVVEAVCKSLRSTVRSDSLLWRSIHIDQPLNEKITDDVLLHLTNRAQGNLQCLSLVECPRITDDGLKRVLEGNPRLTKLSVPGCTRLSIEGIVSSLKAFKIVAIQGIKHLRIGGLYGVTQKHFEELKCLLGIDNQVPQNARKPLFYHRGNFYLSCEDDRPIDIEMCLRCQNLRLVYDCPANTCQGKEHPSQVCRACTLCIARCVQCGRCINDSEYEETFCLELLCSDCWKHLQKCQEKQDRKIDAPKFSTLNEFNCNIHIHG
ncbi:hypothetical protein K2173_005832 [Erythroxylum novogranatense]|uniref:F-box protein SKIP14 n=1 Tax=Erythroxylum novogranatense TaxID=1862640 RepID=A0AAV8U2S8_9ROSI|nr:hypothetical protein K2173_005832 [Erythroxylum novogranatense]